MAEGGHLRDRGDLQPATTGAVRRKRISGPTFTLPHEISFFTSPRARVASSSSTKIGTPRSRRSRSANPDVVGAAMRQYHATISLSERPIEVSSGSSSFH